MHSMAEAWTEAAGSGSAEKFSDLVLQAVGNKPEAALSLLRSCVQLVLAKSTNAAGGSSGALEGGELLTACALLLWES